MHAQFTSPMLHPFMMWVWVFNIQITHRLVVDLLLNRFSGRSTYSEDNRNVLNMSFCSVLSVSKVRFFHVPTTYFPFCVIKTRNYLL